MVFDKRAVSNGQIPVVFDTPAIIVIKTALGDGDLALVVNNPQSKIIRNDTPVNNHYPTIVVKDGSFCTCAAIIDPIFSHGELLKIQPGIRVHPQNAP